MKKIILFAGFLAALAYAACAHIPEGDPPPNDGGGACGECPIDWTCVDGTCVAPPDGGDTPPDGGTCTGPNCPMDGGNGGGSDGGSGGNDGGSGGGSDGGSGGGSDGGTCGTCPAGEVCVGGQCVCDGGDNICGPHKVLLCHYPPGNQDNCQTLCVGIASDKYKGHKRHGDTDGACLPGCVRP